VTREREEQEVRRSGDQRNSQKIRRSGDLRNSRSSVPQDPPKAGLINGILLRAPGWPDPKILLAS
jgi:hypothetical protein